MPEAYLVDAVRTPTGRKKGSLAGLHPADLGAHPIKALIARTGIDPHVVEDVVWGCTETIGGQAGDIGRTAWLVAGLPEEVPGVTVDRQCGSSQQAVHFAAQGVMSTYKGKALGTIGDFGCFSFHETKNYSMGEGGALLIRDPEYNERAEILREKGTNRAKFFRGQVDKYTWVDYGSSYLPSEMNAAYLWGQLQAADQINNDRLASWNDYYQALRPLEQAGKLELPAIPEGCVHNAHMFWVKCRDLEERTAFIQHLKDSGVLAVFHYIPLHSAPAGLRYGRFSGEDVYTTKESDRLVRLPLYYGLTAQDRQQVIQAVKAFFEV